LGFAVNALNGTCFFGFVQPEDRTATLAQIDRLTQGIAIAYLENCFGCRNASFRWLAWSAFFDVASRLIYAAARDITERREEGAAHGISGRVGRSRPAQGRVPGDAGARAAQPA
jgi:hypothetical protein